MKKHTLSTKMDLNQTVLEYIQLQSAHTQLGNKNCWDTMETVLPKALIDLEMLQLIDDRRTLNIVRRLSGIGLEKKSRNQKGKGNLDGRAM